MESSNHSRKLPFISGPPLLNYYNNHLAYESKVNGEHRPCRRAFGDCGCNAGHGSVSVTG
jgi:hypothetical protein